VGRGALKRRREMKAELIEAAKDLGIKVDKRWGKEKLIEVINNAQSFAETEEETEPEASEVYRNVSNGFVYAFGYRVRPGDECTIPETPNQRDIKKFERLIDLGFIEKWH